MEQAARQAVEQQRLLEEEAARQAFAQAGHYWVPQAAQYEQQQQQQQYIQPNPYDQAYPSRVRHHNRSRYDSPPSSTDVPGLLRSGTHETLSSVSSSASSYMSSVSRSGTPLSSISSYEDPELLYDPQTQQYTTSSPMEPAVLRDVVHVQIAGQQPPSLGKHGLLPYEIERSPAVSLGGKPAKKMRLGSNLLSRFLGTSKTPSTTFL